MGRTSTKKDPMDGAHYWQNGKVPADYMNDANGMRPGEVNPPKGVMFTDLSVSHAHAPLPPRSIWKEGKWKNESQHDKGYITWVVSGEGTPGNFLTREYLIHEDYAYDLVPKHPADWKVTTKTTPTTRASALPFGIRFRCPSCGHWYKEADLANHSQVCPSKEDGESDWAISCECCDSLDDTSKCKPGFPRKKAAPPKKTTKAVTRDGGGASAA